MCEKSKLEDFTFREEQATDEVQNFSHNMLKMLHLTVHFHGFSRETNRKLRFRELTDLLAFEIEKIARQIGRGKVKVRVLMGNF